MTGRLRSLADQATPGPWHADMAAVLVADELVASARATDITQEAYAQADQNARLIALAPEMARLLADMADAGAELQAAADALTDPSQVTTGTPSEHIAAVRMTRVIQAFPALLARFRELEERAG